MTLCGPNCSPFPHTATLDTPSPACLVVHRNRVAKDLIHGLDGGHTDVRQVKARTQTRVFLATVIEGAVNAVL